MKIYKVGGAVRDRLLGHEQQDRDWVVVGARPDDLLALGYRRVGRDFPVFLHPITHEEYALARTERKQGVGYHGFIFDTATSVTLEEDLARRDLTINAIAEDDAGNLIDPYGGQRDLAARCLRHITLAFAEDPLRVLRVARFAARFDYAVAPETLALMQTITASGELTTLPAERVWNELSRALQEPYPRRFIEVLRACGALAALFPEVDALFGVPQPVQHHPEIDTGIHLLLTLAESARRNASLAVRFALLMHDLGKAQTPASILPKHYGHEARSAEIAEAFCDRLRIPSELKDIAILVARHHLNVHRALDLKATTLVELLGALDAFRRPDRFDEILQACEIDAIGRGDCQPKPYPPAPYLHSIVSILRQIDAATTVAGKSDPREALRMARVDVVSKIKPTLVPQFTDN